MRKARRDDPRWTWPFPRNVIADLWSNGEDVVEQIRIRHAEAGIPYKEHVELLKQNLDTVLSEMGISKRDKEIFYWYYRDRCSVRYTAEFYRISHTRVTQIVEHIRHLLRNSDRYARLIYTDQEYQEWKENETKQLASIIEQS